MNITSCPQCGGRVRSVSIGWKCEGCNGFIDISGQFHERKNEPFMPPMTNADRIRSMSNEELAEFLILSPEMEFDVCRFCEYGNTSGDDRGICLTKDGICRAEANCAAFKKWLRQPAEKGT